MEHMNPNDRSRIEFLISTGWTVPRIAAEIGRSPSTVRRELQDRRVSSDRRYGCSNRLCAHFDDCDLVNFSATGKGLRKNQAKCFTDCPRFREATCHRLTSSPFVCNGCSKEHNCPLPKKYYVASAAQAAYESLLSTSRLGVHPDDKTVKEMNDVLSPCIRKGQSVIAVMRNNPKTFEGFSRSTVYGWIEDGLFDVRGHELPYAGKRRKPHKKPVTKTHAKCRIGRTYREMIEWLTLHPGIIPCEIDTVIGSISGKVLFTMIFPKSGLALGFLRNAKTSQTCTRIFNTLWEIAGPELFRTLFAAVLGDNGVEFYEPDMIENYRPDPEHNPCKILPRGVKFWYTDPYCSSQKPHIERFHLDLRRVMQKGTSFNMLNQQGVNEVFSNLDSYPRESRGGKTPYDLFVEEHGEAGREFLTKLGIRRVPANQVTLHPFLLGQKYQRMADKAILKKNGVIGQKKTDLEK